MALADFLFARGAMTIKELIDNFGSKFGLTIDEIENQDYLNARYMNGVPLEQIWNSEESNPYLEEETILESWNNAVTGGNVETRDAKETPDSTVEQGKVNE